MSNKRNNVGDHGERGGAGVKLLIVLVILALIGHAGYNYVPVAYEAEDLKQEMQTAVVQGLATARGSAVDAVKQKLRKVIADADVPADTVVEVKEVNKIVQASVSYTKKVNILPFGLYQYDYVFNHTATPTGFLADSL